MLSSILVHLQCICICKTINTHKQARKQSERQIALYYGTLGWRHGNKYSCTGFLLAPFLYSGTQYIWHCLSKKAMWWGMSFLISHCISYQSSWQFDYRCFQQCFILFFFSWQTFSSWQSRLSITRILRYISKEQCMSYNRETCLSMFNSSLFFTGTQVA